MKSELVTLPAIRAFIVPPFWAKGSELSVIWVGLRVGDGRRQAAVEDACAGRERRGAVECWRT